MKKYVCTFSALSFFVTFSDGTQRAVEFSSNGSGRGSSLSTSDEELQNAIEASAYFKCGAVKIHVPDYAADMTAAPEHMRHAVPSTDAIVQRMEANEGLSDTQMAVNIPNIAFDESFVPDEVLKKHKKPLKE